MDVPNLALAGPAAPDSQIYITLKVRHPRGNEAAAFYQNAFGAIPIHHAVQEVGLKLMKTIYLRYNTIIFKVLEVDRNPKLANNSHVIPNIYVDDPASLVRRATQFRGRIVRTECDGDLQLTILKDPYAHVWTIGSSALAPSLYDAGGCNDKQI